MENYTTDERLGVNFVVKNGVKYELVGDYYLIAGEESPEKEPIGPWGIRRQIYLRENRKPIYYAMLTSGTLFNHLRHIDTAAIQMHELLVSQMSKAEGITEQLKAADPMEWIRQMNNICARASEVVDEELIYS